MLKTATLTWTPGPHPHSMCNSIKISMGLQLLIQMSFYMLTLIMMSQSVPQTRRDQRRCSNLRQSRSRSSSLKCQPMETVTAHQSGQNPGHTLMPTRERQFKLLSARKTSRKLASQLIIGPQMMAETPLSKPFFSSYPRIQCHLWSIHLRTNICDWDMNWEF